MQAWCLCESCLFWVPNNTTSQNDQHHSIAGVFRAHHCPEDSSELAEAVVCHHLGYLHRHLLEDR